jgi:hypothetical protein
MTPASIVISQKDGVWNRRSASELIRNWLAPAHIR